MPQVASLRPDDPARLGDYTLAGRLGEGGQGVVYLGHGPDGRPVAVKRLWGRLDPDGKARTRFAREVEIAGRVAPFCTARVITADLDGAAPYVVSEYVEGPSLQARVRDDGPLAGAALDRLAVVTATALAAIHEAGIVHRDFKPGNVLLGPDGPRVIDFGIARALDTTSTITSRIIGTPAYMSPEQINDEALGPPSDMFAWAGTIVYAATGAAPFDGGTFGAVMNRIVHHEPDLGALGEPLRGVVADALSKDPARRPTPRDVLDRMVGGGAAPDVTEPRPSAPPVPSVPLAPTLRAPAPRRAGLALAAPVLGGLIGLYLLTVTLGPRLMESVRTDMGLRDGMTDTLDWMMLLYYPGAAALTAPLGALLGKRRPNAVAAVALGFLLAGAALNGLAGDPGQLLTGRVVSGLGAGALLAGAVVLVRRDGPVRAAGPAAGLGALAALLGAVLGWALTTSLGWRTAFLLAVPPTFAALLLAVDGGIAAVGARSAPRRVT